MNVLFDQNGSFLEALDLQGFSQMEAMDPMDDPWKES